MTAIYKYNGPGKGVILKKPLPRECEIDGETILWMARMCVGEGGYKCSRDKVAMMLWALMRRWMLWDKKRRFPSYLSLMRAFSQPINPRWQMGGDLAYKFRKKDAGSPSRLRRRRNICRLTWRGIPSGIGEAVWKFADGELFPPDSLADCAHPRITNWASLPSTPKKYPWGMRLHKDDDDWFFQDKRILKGIVEVDRI